jgi:hypothetical protein
MVEPTSWISGFNNTRAHRLIAEALFNAILREQLLPTALPEG